MFRQCIGEHLALAQREIVDFKVVVMIIPALEVFADDVPTADYETNVHLLKLLLNSRNIGLQS